MPYSKLRLSGKYFGYPTCCIDWFINERIVKYSRLTKAQDAVHNNKGFIPCPACAESLLKEKQPITSLIKDRICPVNYPNQTPEYETEAWLKEQTEEAHESN